MKKITILIHCKDQPGIIAAVTNFIASKKGNIVYIDQHVDQEQQVFFMRLEGEFKKASYNNSDFKSEFEKTLASNFKMN
jgi:formyltetrahydrofolate deformylase